MIINKIKEAFTKKKNKNQIHSRKDFLLNEESDFYLVESFRELRTNVSFLNTRDENRTCKIFAITSSYPNEGKSTVSSNLAYTLADSQTKVLLIDSDLRKSRIRKFFNVENSNTLSAYLSGQTELENIETDTKLENLKVIVAGKNPPNPVALLSSKRMTALIEEMSKKYDFILIDTPPVNTVADCLVLAHNTDGVIFVVNYMLSTYRDTDLAVNKIKFSQIPIVGFVMNRYVPDGGYMGGSKYGKYGKYGKYKRYGYGRKVSK